MRGILTVLFALLACGIAAAVEPSEILSDPALEARARAISQELRCLVCQNESIDASNAPLARDLRILVRERLSAGDSDDQVKDFIVTRYGEFVLLRPPVTPSTWLLWFAPLLAVLMGALALALYLRRMARRMLDATLTVEEQRRLDEELRSNPE